MNNKIRSNNMIAESKRKRERDSEREPMAMVMTNKKYFAVSTKWNMFIL